MDQDKDTIDRLTNGNWEVCNRENYLKYMDLVERPIPCNKEVDRLGWCNLVYNDRCYVLESI